MVKYRRVIDTSSNPRTDTWTAACVWLIFLIPLFSFPLIWIPPTWMIRFPYQFEFPWPGVALAALTAVIALAIRRGSVQLGSKPLIGVIASVACSWMLSIATSSQLLFSLTFLPSYLGFIALFYIGSQISESLLCRICRVWFVTVIVTILFGLARLMTVPDFAATFGNRNFLAAFLTSGLIIGFTMIARYVRHGQRWFAIWTGLGCALILVGLRLCGSRGAWLGLLAVASVWFVVWAPLMRDKQWWKLAVVVVVAGVGLITVIPYAADVWSTDVRPPIWEGTMRMIEAKPVTGHGLETYNIPIYGFLPPDHYNRPLASSSLFHAHNLILELVAEQGLIGLGVVIGLWVFVFHRVLVRVKLADCHPDIGVCYLGILLSVLAYLVHNMVDVNSRTPPMQALGWLMLGLMAAAGEQDVSLGIQWKTGIHKRPFWGGLLALVAVGFFWTSVVQPVRGEYHEQMARIAAAQRDWELAAVHAEKSLEAAPCQLEVRFMYAGVFAEWSRIVRETDPRLSIVLRKIALTQCQELRRIAPDYDTVAIRLAFLLSEDGQKEQAVKLAEWVLARRPKEKDALRLIFLLNKEKNERSDEKYKPIENQPKLTQWTG